jgi:hypothetical protein
MKQCFPDLVFKLLDLHAQGWLRNETVQGSFAEAAYFDDR